MDFRQKNIRLQPIHYRGRRLYFITLCCEFRASVFSKPENAQYLIACLKITAERYQLGIDAFCVMPDDFHALVEGVSPDSDLLLFVRKFKQASSREYSRGRGMPLWQKKFYDHILRSKDSPEAVSWDIWMNPVRKGLCRQPIQYPFSGSFTEQWEKKVRPLEEWVPAWKKNQVARP
jgi:putative transposase